MNMIASSLLEPFLADAIDYPWSPSMRNRAIGLEAVSLFLVAPLCILAGLLSCGGARQDRLWPLGRPRTPHTCSCST